VTAAKRGIRRALASHLAALGTLGREPQLTADLTVLRRDVYATRRDSFRFVGVAPRPRHQSHEGGVIAE
jgi:hypothetical protein